jgi:hypothetical protein
MIAVTWTYFWNYCNRRHANISLSFGVPSVLLPRASLKGPDSWSRPLVLMLVACSEYFASGCIIVNLYFTCYFELQYGRFAI